MEYVHNKATTNIEEKTKHWNIFITKHIGRVLNVTGAGYADCNGLYTLSNNTRYQLISNQSLIFSNPLFASIWDSKRVVYERIAGGWGREKRWKIYIILILILFQCSAEMWSGCSAFYFLMLMSHLYSNFSFPRANLPIKI